MKVARLLMRLLVAGVFIYAGAVKSGADASGRFTVTVAQMNLLPPPWVGVFVSLLPWIEIIAGVLILIPRTTRIGAWMAAALLAVFIAALTWAWTQGLAVDCGCFGAEDVMTSTRDQIPTALARDAVLLALTLLLAVRRAR